jgi:putative transposase
VFVRISDVQHYFWRVFDHKAEVLEAFVSKTRHKQAALKCLRELMRRHERPRTTLE